MNSLLIYFSFSAVVMASHQIYNYEFYLSDWKTKLLFIMNIIISITFGWIILPIKIGKFLQENDFNK